MSDTPRTDAKEDETQLGSETDIEISNRHSYYAWKFARQLERELIAACEERDRYKAAYQMADKLLEQMSTSSAYEGKRTGGILKGCPREPDPKPEQIAARVKIALDVIRKRLEGK